MEIQSINKKRSIQVLEKLREHGPLSMKTLEEVLVPKISKRRIQEVTARLVKNNLIFRLDPTMSNNGSHIFEIRRTVQSLERISKKLKIPSNEFDYCYVRRWEQRHGEQCARWAEFFRRKFPEAKITRDWELKRDSFLTERVLPSGGDRDLFPDILVSFRQKSPAQGVVVAVEIERNYKKTERVVRKTKDLFMGTQIDGVIYVCSEAGIGERVRRSFLSNKPEKSRRIGGYFENFLTFSSYNDPLDSEDISLVNASMKPVSLKQWIGALCAVPTHLRKNLHFEKTA